MGKSLELKRNRVFVYPDGIEKTEAEMTEQELIEARKKITDNFIKGFSLKKNKSGNRVS